MPTYLEQLKQSRDNVAAQLAEITANPRPNYSIDGQSVSWADYVRMLTQAQEDLSRLLAQAEPYVFKSQAW